MNRRYFIPIGVIVVLLILWRIAAIITSGEESRSGRGGRPPVAVEIDSVRYGPIQDIRRLTGSVFPQYQYVISPKVSGRVVDLRVRIGDRVRAGQIIGKIDDAEYQQAVIEAEANLKIAQSSFIEAGIQFELAREEKDRVETLLEKGISSPSELDAAVSNYSAQESRLDLAKAQVEQREASLEAARIRFGYTRLSASKPGLIGQRFVDEGALLAPNAAVVSVVGIDSVIVRVSVTERDYGFIQQGQHAEVAVDAYPDRQFAGDVARIAPLLEETSRVAQLEVEIENDEQLLKPGMFARVDIRIAARDSTQIVPTQALARRNTEIGVFTIASDEPVARYLPVEVGISTPAWTEILSPSLKGPVITLGQHLIEDGSPILIPSESSSKDVESADQIRGIQ